MLQDFEGSNDGLMNVQREQKEVRKQKCTAYVKVVVSKM